MSYLGTDAPHRFFGTNARAIAQVETRRNPLAFSMYAVVCALGAIFVFHLYAPGRSQAELFPGISHWAIFTWKWMMFVGGGASAGVLFFNPRPHPHWPDIVDLLHIEAIFAGISAGGLIVYMVVVVRLTGWGGSEQALAVYGLIVAGHLMRAWHCVKDAARLVQLNDALIAEQAARNVAG